MGWRDDAENQGLPGCGLAIYTLLLLGLCVLGIVGMVMGSLGLLAGDGTSPSELLSGTSVTPDRLKPMRAAGALGPTEIPAAWHDESLLMDGSRACALTAEGVVRLEDGVVTRARYAEITDTDRVELPEGGELITIQAAPGPVVCPFGPREGAVRFERQIQAELLKIQRGS